MNYEEAKVAANAGQGVYAARVDGCVWEAGRMVEFGDVIGYYLSREEADDACHEYELFDFDAKHMSTSVEVLTAEYFND